MSKAEVMQTLPMYGCMAYAWRGHHIIMHNKNKSGWHLAALYDDRRLDTGVHVRTYQLSLYSTYTQATCTQADNSYQQLPTSRAFGEHCNIIILSIS